MNKLLAWIQKNVSWMIVYQYPWIIVLLAAIFHITWWIALILMSIIAIPVLILRMKMPALLYTAGIEDYKSPQELQEMVHNYNNL